ncbi:hypothetical protein [Dyadobacter pollutisoli]|uniref:Exo-alpha-sialidase n=1 Tax=Dyadobacter pollutisoli TaxID=2910158 RepID=A0A9E8NDJ8_9BACT|nr:hypothetical protein [Dyadobacter pollutisoli]WAC12521.1 hypothetical protein ON006_00875 [Dyadobacter pollutisoli]
MKVFLYCFFLMAVLSCTRSGVDAVEQDTVLNEYPDWYTLKSPVDHQIEGVWGNYNKTVLISTMFKVFRTTDQGKQWKQVLEQSVGIMGIVQYQDTLFTMSGLSNQTTDDLYQQVLVDANNYSVDDGKTWQRYVARNPILGGHPEFDSPNKFLINPIVAPNKVTYQINKAFRDGPNATSGVYETPGVIKSTGERIDLPQLHQIQSLFLDDQKRIYIVGSDAVCGSEQSFKFCNSQGGRGVVYVSKKSLP